MSRALARITTGAGLALVAAALCVPLQGSTTWALGDLFVGIGGGAFQVRSNAGALKETLGAGASGDTAGCGLDASLNAYLVNTTEFKISVSSQQGAQTISTDPNPQSIVFASNGDFYVGHLGGLIRRYVKNANGYQAKEHFFALFDTMDSFWLDIAADQKTIFYTSGGRNIHKVAVDIHPQTNVATFSGNQVFKPLPNTPTGPVGSWAARALRVLPPGPGAGEGAIIGGILVADKVNIKWVNADGNVIGQFDASDASLNPTQQQNDWFPLALDPRDVDEATVGGVGADVAFWAGDKTTGKLWRFRVQSGFGRTGNQAAGPAAGPFTTGAAGSLRGLCLNGEPTTGQYSVLLKFSDQTLSQTAVFASGTAERHFFGVELKAMPTEVLAAVVNAREVISDGLCASGLATDTSDVDCGFKTYFSNPTFPNPPNDPLPPKGAPYVHGRAVHYRLRWLTVTPDAVVSVGSDASLTTVTQLLGNCTYPSPSDPLVAVTAPRALRIFRDPSSTQEDQFAEDLTEKFFLFNPWGARTGSRFMIAGRCAAGFSEIRKPADGRTFKAGNAIPIELRLTDLAGNPIQNATTDPHSIAVTVSSAGVIHISLGTPGSSPNFFNQTSPGMYIANLSTTGLPASTSSYNLCISDRIDPAVQNEAPLYPQRCVEFFLK